jgi:hypothetical protein
LLAERDCAARDERRALTQKETRPDPGCVRTGQIR